MRLTYSIVAIILLTVFDSAAGENHFLFRPGGANFYVYGKGNSSFIVSKSKSTAMGLDKMISQLSSGRRINSASDDPAGFAVAAKMTSFLNQLKQESMNDGDMRSLHNVIEAAVAEDQRLLHRIRILIVQASNGILNTEDRAYIQAEIDQFLKQINLNAEFSQFNRKRIISDLTIYNLGLHNVNVVHNLWNSIGFVDTALAKLTKRRIIHGIKSNVITLRIKGRSYQYLNLQRSESLISDADMAEGITRLIKNSVLLKSQHGLIFRSK